MAKAKHIILGVHVTERMNHVPQVQKFLSEFGCYIKTRLGLHEVSENVCSTNGLMLLEMFGDEKKCLELKDKLNTIDGVEVKSMEFDHK
jgi:hypothetical protein